MSLICISREYKIKEILFMGRKFSFPLADIFSLCQRVNLFIKTTVQNVGCVYAYFCGGHKINLG